MNPLEELLTAVGVLAETCGLLRDELMKNGFTREEALSLTTEYFKFLLVESSQNKEE